MKILRSALFALLALAIFASCSSDDDDKSKVFIDLDLNAVMLKLISTAAGDFLNAKIEDDGSILIDKNTNKNILEKFEEALEDAFEAIEDAHEEAN